MLPPLSTIDYMLKRTVEDAVPYKSLVLTYHATIRFCVAGRRRAPTPTDIHRHEKYSPINQNDRTRTNPVIFLYYDPL